MNPRKRIINKLMQSFMPDQLDVVDETHLHAGHLHSGDDSRRVFKSGDQTHFRVRIVSSVFWGMDRVARHRAVYSLLIEELRDGVHALSITALTPGEAI